MAPWPQYSLHIGRAVPQEAPRVCFREKWSAAVLGAGGGCPASPWPNNRHTCLLAMCKPRMHIQALIQCGVWKEGLTEGVWAQS